VKYSQQAALFPLATGVGEYLGKPHDFSLPSAVKPLGPLLDVVMEVDTFTDTAPHRMASFAVQPNRTNFVVLFISAQDNAGVQIAFSVQPLTITRFGEGPILIIATPLPVPIPLNFSGPAAWTTTLVESSPGQLALEVTDVGSPNIPVRWKVVFFILGTQL
jgi:hypothetical protein